MNNDFKKEWLLFIKIRFSTFLPNGQFYVQSQQ